MQGEFQKFVQEANEFINNVSLETNLNNHDAYRAVKTVFFTLREILTPEESMHLVSQMPMLLKAMYIDNWKLSQSSNYKKIRNAEDFYKELNNKNEQLGREKKEEDPVKNFEVVFNLLKKYISEGEINDIRAQLPKEVKELI